MYSPFGYLQDSLQKDFGAKTGEMLWNYSRGVDNRQVGLIQVRKTYITSFCYHCIKFETAMHSCRQSFLLLLLFPLSLPYIFHNFTMEVLLYICFYLFVSTIIFFKVQFSSFFCHILFNII